MAHGFVVAGAIPEQPLTQRFGSSALLLMWGEQQHGLLRAGVHLLRAPEVLKRS